MSKRLLLLVACLWLLNSSVSRGRTWTDATGELTVEAEFVTRQFGKVWLLRSDGKVFGIAPTELSQSDQEYVRQRLQERAARKKTTANPAGRIPYGPGRSVCILENEAIAESSGLACSRHKGGFFWTHNDSGGDARIYLFDQRGRDLGSCELKNTFAYDFEDMFSFRADGKNFLVLCDVGNNGRAAPVQMLHVVEEPTFDAERGAAAASIPVVQTIYLSYEDDHRDCEAVGIDPTSKTMLLASKERDSQCHIYALPWPDSTSEKAHTARIIATLDLPFVTALDISPDGRRAVLLTYETAFEFVRDEDESWSQAFSRAGREIVVPERIQGESICYGSDGKTLYLTSEKRPTPLLVVPVEK